MFGIPKKLFLSALAGGVMLLSASAPVMAQDFFRVEEEEVRRGVTVTDRKRPELEPLGMRLGGFLLYPALAVSESYNDNIFATDGGETDDFITSIVPTVSLKSNWNNHALNLGAGANIGRYKDNSHEDYEDFILKVDGRLDITRRSNFSGAINYSRRHEERSSPDDVGGAKPSEYDIFAARLGFFQRFNRLSVRLKGDYRQFDFDDAINKDRNRSEYDLSVRAGYEIVPQYEAFVRATYYLREYQDGSDDSGFDRDSDGYEAVVGTVIDFSGVTFGDLFVGYRSQVSDDPALNDVEGITFGAGITWNVGKLTTAKFKVTRIVYETTVTEGADGAAGAFKTSFGATVDHELLRNLLIGGGLDWSRNEFEGVSREDDELAANIYGKYFLNRNLYLSLNYRYRERDSNTSSEDFDRNLIMLKLETQL